MACSLLQNSGLHAVRSYPICVNQLFSERGNIQIPHAAIRRSTRGMIRHLGTCTNLRSRPHYWWSSVNCADCSSSGSNCSW